MSGTHLDVTKVILGKPFGLVAFVDYVGFSNLITLPEWQELSTTSFD